MAVDQHHMPLRIAQRSDNCRPAFSQSQRVDHQLRCDAVAAFTHEVRRAKSVGIIMREMAGVSNHFNMRIQISESGGRDHRLIFTHLAFAKDQLPAKIRLLYLITVKNFDRANPRCSKKR